MSGRSLLFVPGDRPDRFAKAIGAGADMVAIDLEDAVAAHRKDAARAAAFEYRADGGVRIGIRVNAPATVAGIRDLAALVGARKPAFLMLPKAEAPAELAILSAAAPGVPLWPIIETIAGLRAATAIAAAPNVEGLLFGGVDLATQLGTEMGWEALLHPRATLVLAAAEARVQLFDVPEIDIHDLAKLEEGCLRAKALGFSGRACIHPSQVAIVSRIYAFSDEEIARAKRIVAASEAASGGAVLLDGRLVERPLVAAAQRTLARAGA